MLTEKMKESVMATRVTVEIQRLVDEVATVQGLNPSEYLRKLIVEDLENRSLISTKLESLKEEIRNSHKETARSKIIFEKNPDQITG
jgi:hypothetical protein